MAEVCIYKMYVGRLYDRVLKMKIYFEFTAFQNYGKGTSRAKKFKTLNENCYYFILNSYALEVPRSFIIKIGGNF